MKKMLLFIILFLIAISVVRAEEVQDEIYSITTNPKVLAALTVDKKSAKPGDTVTVSVKSVSKGYALESIVISDTEGTKLNIELKDLGNGNYAFTMPRSNLYIDVILTSVNPRTADSAYIIIILLVASAIFTGILYSLRKGVNKFE